MKRRNKIILQLTLCVLVYIGLQIWTIASDNSPSAAFNGVRLAIQFGACLLITQISNKKGIILSVALQGLSLLFLTRALVFGDTIAVLPGYFNTIVYIVTIIILNNQFKARERDAVTDLLTGLMNRRGLEKTIKYKIDDRIPFHLICIDLHNYKLISDSYGHTRGTMLLKILTRKMEAVIGKSGVLAKIGSDEFVIVLDGRLDPGRVANELLEMIREKTTLYEEGSKADIYLVPYAGVASYPEHATDAESLMKYADIAMAGALKEKSNIAVFFDETMMAQISRQLELESLIKEAMENDYFYLVYQPQYLIKGKKLRGFETLIRLKTPDGVFVSPGEFIPVAEKTGLILDIDDYVLKRAMREFKPIVEKNPDLIISINVSAKNIGDPNFYIKVQEIMDEVGYPARNLEIEITEYCMVQSVDITIDNITKLREIGVVVALDDFGTGYTSLAYLAKMPIHLLKIDKSLVDNIETDKKAVDFVTAVISMGHLMGCEVIAEGVEHDEQLAVLGAKECDFVQGYVWGKPLPYETARSLAVNE